MNEDAGRITAALNLIGWKISAQEVVGVDKSTVLIVTFIHGTRDEPNTFAPLAMTLESAEEVADALRDWCSRVRAQSIPSPTDRSASSAPSRNHRKRQPKRRR